MSILRFIIITVELILCYVLQSSVWTELSMGNTTADLLMIIVVAAAYINGSNSGIVYGFCAGMIMDLTYGTHLGFCALLYLFAGFLAGLFHRFYRKDDNVTPLALVALCVFLYMNVYYITEFMIRGRLDYGFYLKDIILPKVVYTVLIASVLYKLCQLSIGWSARSKELEANRYD